MSPLTIKQAKERITIHHLWRHFDLPGEPSTSCRSPFREEQRASFSVSEDGLLWNDFGIGRGGDAIDFLQEATGLSRRNAILKFLALAAQRNLGSLRVIKRPRTAPQERPAPIFPQMRPGSQAEHEALAELRGVSSLACLMASNAGLLRFGKWKGHDAWFITDKDGKNAQARRMDGLLWNEIQAKAWTLPGSWASWPLGISTGSSQNCCLVEGGPDLLAACHFIFLEARTADCFPVGMLGASQQIHIHALPFFAGKRVRIYPHADDAGRSAAARWSRQLIPHGVVVDAVDFSGLRKRDGAPVKDLNDCTLIHPNDAEHLEGILP